MKPIKNFIPCAKCGNPDIPKITRRRIRNGKVRFSISSSCVLCHREDAGVINRRHYTNNKNKRHKEAKEWRNKNREQYNESQRVWYSKNKERIREKLRSKYIKKTRMKGWNGVRTPLSKVHPWRNFDFKNRKVNNGKSLCVCSTA